jgi:hypothetical protein
LFNYHPDLTTLGLDVSDEDKQLGIKATKCETRDEKDEKQPPSDVRVLKVCGSTSGPLIPSLLSWCPRVRRLHLTHWDNRPSLDILASHNHLIPRLDMLTYDAPMGGETEATILTLIDVFPRLQTLELTDNTFTKLKKQELLAHPRVASCDLTISIFGRRIDWEYKS